MARTPARRLKPSAIETEPARNPAPTVDEPSVPDSSPAPAWPQPETQAPDAPGGTQAPETSAIMQLFQMTPANADNTRIAKLVNQMVSDTIKGELVADRYNVVVLHDSSSIRRSDTNRIYKAVGSFAEKKPLLLILHSMGGGISAAYFIAKLCREHLDGGFCVVVPREAKSAASLICCGAERIHMGALSELGPIDPQIDGVPALAFKHSIEHLAELVKRFPDATEMFATYLGKNLRIEALGYYERVAESAAQYAERLLAKRKTIPRDDAAIREIARRLVYSYKDHGFAIDDREAEEIFGSAVVQHNTEEYVLGNKLYEVIDLVSWVVTAHLKKGFYFTGTAADGAFVANRD